MDYMSQLALLETNRQELERQAEQARRGQDLPSRPVAWRVWLVMAVILVGMIVLWIH